MSNRFHKINLKKNTIFLYMKKSKSLNIIVDQIFPPVNMILAYIKEKHCQYLIFNQKSWEIERN